MKILKKHKHGDAEYWNSYLWLKVAPNVTKDEIVEAAEHGFGMQTDGYYSHPGGGFCRRASITLYPEKNLALISQSGGIDI